MRRTAPVYFDASHYSWNVFRYQDVQQALSDYAHFSSQFGNGRQDASQPLGASMISTDPPRHRQLRALVTQAFTPRAVDALAPRIATIVNDLLDQVMARGEMDVIDDFGVPLPVTVIAEMLGIPPADRERFKLWSDAVVSSADAGGGDGYSDGAGRAMAAYFMEMIEQRRRAPGDDLISGLLAAEIDGQHLTLPELLGFGSLLLVAGNETTTNLLGNALLTFAERPDIWAQLRADPQLLPQAIEEVLRYRSPVQSMFRVTTSEVTLGEKTIPSGSWVIAWIGSANHDEAQFADPGTYDLQRTPNRHLAFGHGIHFCLGAPLARLEARIALQAMLERFRSVELVPGARLERMPSTIVYGPRSVPMRFS
jgi:cytochrome P450